MTRFQKSPFSCIMLCKRVFIPVLLICIRFNKANSGFWLRFYFIYSRVNAIISTRTKSKQTRTATCFFFVCLCLCQRVGVGIIQKKIGSWKSFKDRRMANKPTNQLLFAAMEGELNVSQVATVDFCLSGWLVGRFLCREVQQAPKALLPRKKNSWTRTGGRRNADGIQVIVARTVKFSCSNCPICNWSWLKSFSKYESFAEWFFSRAKVRTTTHSNDEIWNWWVLKINPPPCLAAFYKIEPGHRENATNLVNES